MGMVLGGTGDYVKLKETTLTSAGNSIDVAGIPGGFDHLHILCQIQKNSSGPAACYIQFNGDTGTNYLWRRHYGGHGSSVGEGLSGVSGSGIQFGESSGTWDTQFNVMVIDIPFYSRTVSDAQVLSTNYRIDNDTTSHWRMDHGGVWKNTAAITSTHIWQAGVADFSIGSSCIVYGLR